MATTSTAAQKGPRCVLPDCRTIASRALPGSTVGIFCVRHAEPAMVNVINWTECRREGCGKYPTFGAAAAGSGREFCSEHAPEGMVDVHRKKCAVEGCPKRASHGVKGSGRRLVCGEHASGDMSDLGQKFCRFSGPDGGDCESVARYGVRGSKRREFCSRHAPDGMVNMNDKLCAHGDCPKLPTYGQEGTKVGARGSCLRVSRRKAHVRVLVERVCLARVVYGGLLVACSGSNCRTHDAINAPVPVLLVVICCSFASCPARPRR